VRSNHEAWIWNSIIYFNTGAGVAVGQPVASHSCVQGGLPGTAMVNADPLFVDVAGGNFRLSSASPCIDRGDNGFSSSALDLDFTPRFEDVTNVTDLGLGIGPIVDLGAYESPGGLFDWFCASGSSMAANCPCGNEGQTGRGCRHSAWNSVGGLLSASGTANPDTVQLTASELRGGVLCIFLQGNVAISGGGGRRAGGPRGGGGQ
jgi:hypothetical protein